jgi:hypothetical protein
MLFTILFGLSTDYELFLMSRVRERWIRHRDSQSAVTDGLVVTARVITAAAAIMVCVFASFALSDERPLRTFGLGMATAVLVDATVVRLVLAERHATAWPDRLVDPALARPPPAHASARGGYADRAASRGMTGVER